MLGWLTVLLFTLLVISTANVRERATFDAATPSGQAELNSVDTNYQVLLNAYKTAYIASKQPNASADTPRALSTVEASIEAIHDQLRSHIAQNQFYIQTFLDEYENLNPDLAKLHNKAQVFRSEGPKIADELAASTGESSAPVDYGSLVTRVVVLVILLGVGLAINAFA
jgi:hypothetical protein